MAKRASKKVTKKKAQDFDGMLEQLSPETQTQIEQLAQQVKQEAPKLKQEEQECSDPTPATAATVAVPSTSTAGAPSVKTAVTGEGLAGKLKAVIKPVVQPIHREPVANMVPTEEQWQILQAARQSGLKSLVICAGAGAGKTSTLKMLEQVLKGRGQYTAFNASLVTESKAKFVRARCNTTHSLAFGTVGRDYAHRLNGNRMRSEQIATMLGIQDMEVKVGEPKINEKGEKVQDMKRLAASFLAGQVLVAVKSFCQSADREIEDRHFRYIDGIDAPVVREDGSTRRGYANNQRVRDYLLPFASKAWQDLCDTKGQLPFHHDVYVKIWQLGTGDNKPFIAADYILLDEHQDTAPVFVDVLKQQTHALVVLVGDDNQRIYEWRGAINAGEEFPDAMRLQLSQSFRFGQTIADVANSILQTLDESDDLVMKGLPSIPSRVCEVAQPRCYLYRTNAGAVGRVMKELAEGRKPHLIGGSKEVVTFMKAVIELQQGRPTRHPELCCFNTWPEVVQYSEMDEGEDLRLLVKLITEFTAEAILNALESMPEEKDADCVISTAHKSKGREWPSVKLGGDFPPSTRMNDAARRLLYVAATRAQYELDLSECPPFLNWRDPVTGKTSPAIYIDYTQDMPTAEQLQTYLEEKTQAKAKKQESAAVAPLAHRQPTIDPETAEFTWASYDGGWAARGPAGLEGQTVNVKRKDGGVKRVVLRSVVQTLPNKVCLYRV